MIDLVMLNFSFAAGVAAFFNPCGFAMLPAYVSYYLGRGERTQEHWLRSSLQGLSLGLTVSGGFFTVFGGLGLIFSLIGAAIAPYIPFATALIGLLLITLGIWTLLGDVSLPSLAGSMERLVARFLPQRPPDPAGSSTRRRLIIFYLFGVSYAICSVGCTLPIFMVVVSQAIAKGLFNGVVQFLAYAWGMSLLMLALSLTITLTHDALYHYFSALTNIVQKISGLVLIGAGAYIIWYQLVYAGILNL
jgi:cytochrome c biogenesis protein CcdA